MNQPNTRTRGRAHGTPSKQYVLIEHSGDRETWKLSRVRFAEKKRNSPASGHSPCRRDCLEHLDSFPDLVFFIFWIAIGVGAPLLNSVHHVTTGRPTSTDPIAMTANLVAVLFGVLGKMGRSLKGFCNRVERQGDPIPLRSWCIETAGTACDSLVFLEQSHDPPDAHSSTIIKLRLRQRLSKLELLVCTLAHLSRRVPLPGNGVDHSRLSGQQPSTPLLSNTTHRAKVVEERLGARVSKFNRRLSSFFLRHH